MNIVELIFFENTGHSGPALIEGGRSVSYPELFKDVRSVAKQLEAGGLKKGAYVAIYMRGGIDYIVISLAVLLCGAVLVPIIETAGEEEIRDVLRTVGAEMLISGRRLLGLRQVVLNSGTFPSKRDLIYWVPQGVFDPLESV